MSEPTDTNTGKRITTAAIRVIGYLIYAYLVVVEIILSLTFILLLFGANSSSGFVEWIYRSADRAMRPFRGIFEPIELGTTNNDVPAVFDTSIVFAMIIYGLLAIALHSLLDWLTDRINRIDRENTMRAQQAAYDAAVAASAASYPASADTGPATVAPAPATPVPPADPSAGTYPPAPPPPPTR